jgi:hypothetical protein
MMVAYSFRQPFVDPIRLGLKRHTIRGHRRRHARPGEPMQTYTGMRTRHCTRILDPDPVCTAVRHIEIAVEPPATIAAIEIEGVPVEPSDAFAAADGFEWSSLRWSRDWGPLPDTLHFALEPGRGRWVMGDFAPLAVMGMFWRWMHGLGRFDGVILDWAEPHPSAYPDFHLPRQVPPWRFLAEQRRMAIDYLIITEGDAA